MNATRTESAPFAGRPGGGKYSVDHLIALRVNRGKESRLRESERFEKRPAA